MQKKAKVSLFLLVLTVIAAYSQPSDSTKLTAQISGNANATNNGISLIPNFSLEQPAAVFNMSLEKGRFSFDPEFAFSLEEGRPWYQLFWLRYKLVDKGKFRLGAGSHLGLNFVRHDQPTGSDPMRLIVTERYLVGELVPTYSIGKKVSVGMYYLLSRGFDIGTTKPTHFLTLNASFTHLTLSKKLFFNFMPQVYYLNLFGNGGNYYATSSFGLGMVGAPFTLNAVVNKAIKTDIANSKGFIWNLNLNYSFVKRPIRRPAPAFTQQ